MVTFYEIIHRFDQERKEQFGALQKRSEATSLNAEESYQLDMAPVRRDVVFLQPLGEPIFDPIYSALEEMAEQKEPSIHFGIAGTRNLSIVGAAKSNAAILADFNLNQQELMECLRETAHKLLAEKELEDITPRDFVVAFSDNEKATALLQAVPHEPEKRSRVHTSLDEELTAPDSWLYEKQEDGRFHHVMKLYAEDKIATLAINAADKKGLEDLAGLLRGIKQEMPELGNTEIGTVFLANLPYFLAKKEGYGAVDRTPRDALFPILEGFRAFGNPYSIMAKEPLAMWNGLQNGPLRGKVSPHYEQGKINGASAEQVRRYKSIYSAKYKSDWQQMTLGGALDTVLECLHLIDDRNSRMKARSTPVYGSHTQNYNDEKREGNRRTAVR